MRTFLDNMDVGTHQNVKTKKIIQFLLREKEKTIPEIRDFCGLSLPTTLKFVNDLVGKNILIESGKKESSGGRRPNLYSLNPNQGYIVGVELLLKSFRISIINLNHEVIYDYETDNFDISKRDDAFDFFTPAAVSEPTMVGADLMDLELEPEPDAPVAERTKAVAPSRTNSAANSPSEVRSAVRG